MLLVLTIPRCTGTGTDSVSVLIISIFVRTRLRLRTWIRCYLMPVLFPYLSIWKYSRTRTRTRTSFSESFRTPYYGLPIFFRTRTRTPYPYPKKYQTRFIEVIIITNLTKQLENTTHPKPKEIFLTEKCIHDIRIINARISFIGSFVLWNLKLFLYNGGFFCKTRMMLKGQNFSLKQSNTYPSM